MGPKSNVRHPYKEKVSGRQTDTEREEGHEGLPSGNVQWEQGTLTQWVRNSAERSGQRWSSGDE